jgi:hypothetical protein
MSHSVLLCSGTEDISFQLLEPRELPAVPHQTQQTTPDKLKSIRTRNSYVKSLRHVPVENSGRLPAFGLRHASGKSSLTERLMLHYTPVAFWAKFRRSYGPESSVRQHGPMGDGQGYQPEPSLGPREPGFQAAARYGTLIRLKSDSYMHHWVRKCPPTTWASLAPLPLRVQLPGTSRPTGWPLPG